MDISSRRVIKPSISSIPTLMFDEVSLIFLSTSSFLFRSYSIIPSIFPSSRDISDLLFLKTCNSFSCSVICPVFSLPISFSATDTLFSRSLISAPKTERSFCKPSLFCAVRSPEIFRWISSRLRYSLYF